MKKSILNIGKVLNKTQQKQINGGNSTSGCFCGLFLRDEFGGCAYRINGDTFYGVEIDNCCC